MSLSDLALDWILGWTHHLPTDFTLDDAPGLPPGPWESLPPPFGDGEPPDLYDLIDQLVDMVPVPYMGDLPQETFKRGVEGNRVNTDRKRGKIDGYFRRARGEGGSDEGL